MLENEFTKQVIKLAKLHGWRVAHFRPAMLPGGKWVTPVQGDGAGFPDLVLVREKVLFIELKTDEGDMDDEQIKWMADLMIAGAEVGMWCPSRMKMIQQTLRGNK